jgi:GntR family transcriptional regulator
VLTKIRSENLKPDTKLPSESELCRQFGVSRIVVREAMAQLVAARVIYRLQGKGAFVAPHEEALSFVGATRGFTDELLEQNHVVTRRILRQFLGIPDARARDLLQLGREEEAVHLDRVLLVDGVPRILVRTVLPHSLVPGLEQFADGGQIAIRNSSTAIRNQLHQSTAMA